MCTSTACWIFAERYQVFRVQLVLSRFSHSVAKVLRECFMFCAFVSVKHSTVYGEDSASLQKGFCSLFVETAFKPDVWYAKLFYFVPHSSSSSLHSTSMFRKGNPRRMSNLHNYHPFRFEWVTSHHFFTLHNVKSSVLETYQKFSFRIARTLLSKKSIETFPHKIVCYISQEWFQCFRSTFVSENSSKVPGRLMKCIHRRECITVGPQQSGRIIRAIFVLRNEISLRRHRISGESQHALCMRSSTTHRCRPSTHILPPMS